MSSIKKASFIFLLLVTVASAQNGKSPVSRFGIGELHTYTSARERGMGSVSSAGFSTYDISQTNPALWSRLEGIRLAADMAFDYEEFNVDNESFSYMTSRIKSLRLSFPINDDYGVRLSAGLIPVSRIDYEVTGRGEESGEEYMISYGGTGGISAFRIGASFMPLESVSIGAAYQLYFGTTDQNWIVDFDNEDLYQTKQSRATSHSGSGVLLGIHYTGIRNLSLGMSFSPEATLDATQNRVYRFSYGDSTVEGEHGTVTIPARLTASATYAFSPVFLAGVEYQSQDWTDAMMFDAKQNQLGNAYKIGAGIEWYPGEKPEAEEEFWKRVALRFGFYHAQNYIDMDTEYQKEYAVTAGVGIPIYGINRADFSLEYGFCGSDSAPESGAWLGKRNFVRLTVAVSAGEQWFKRRSAYDN